MMDLETLTYEQHLLLSVTFNLLVLVAYTVSDPGHYSGVLRMWNRA